MDEKLLHGTTKGKRLRFIGGAGRSQNNFTSIATEAPKNLNQFHQEAQAVKPMHQSAETSNLVRIFLQILACGILELLDFSGGPRAACSWASKELLPGFWIGFTQTKSDLRSHFLMENMVI